jgi:hypothetical protein
LYYNGIEVGAGTTVSFDGKLNITKTISFRIENAGTEPLLLRGSAPVISGSEDFVVTQPAKLSLAKGDANGISFSISWNPSALKTYTGTLAILSNDPGGSFECNLSGPATQAEARLQFVYDGADIARDGTINLGDVTIGAAASAVVTIRNAGDAMLVIESAALSGAGAAEWTLKTQPASGVSGGDATSFSIEAAPIVEGERSVILTIGSNDPAGEAKIAIKLNALPEA